MNTFSFHSPDLKPYRPNPLQLLPWWLAYLIFVVYGSLVPLDYRPLPLGQAWEMFRHIRLLDVGAGGRADWVANGVLYVPVGFLTAGLLAGPRRARPPLAAMVGAVGFAWVLAVVVEFAQVAFPPRTVSLNDVLAEFSGGGLGAALAGVAAGRFRALLAAMGGQADRLAPRLLKAYAIGYAAFSLFPYDFLLSIGELADKFHSDRWGWLWPAGGGRGGGAAAVAKMVAEALAAMPLGWLLAGRGHSARQVCVAGAALGAIIEFAQFFLVSGVSQGISVLTRAAGTAAGALLWRHRGRLDLIRLAALLRRVLVPVLAAYGLALLAVNGWFEHPWRGPAAAAEALGEARFLPFYYHYYTTEQVALLSLASVCLMYAPIGILAWASFSTPALALWAAALAAAAIETSKLFLTGLHPDPTNILLAGLAAWTTARLTERLAVTAASPGSWAGRPTVPADGVGAPAVARNPVGGKADRHRPGGRPFAFAWAAGPVSGVVGAGVALTVVVWGVATFPLLPVLLGLLLTGYGALLWHRPERMLVAIPAALALFDLAPWSGRYYFDEFDMLVLVSVAVGYLRLAPASKRGMGDPLLLATTVLLSFSYAIGVLRGLLPWQWPDLNTFSNYYSPFNALRIAKGALWAFLLLGLMRRFAAAGVDVRRLFGAGMVIGLAGTVAVVVWERAAFPGLFNFTDVYRVTGPFSQMHTGGADIECYLTVATPFLVLRMLECRAWTERLLGLALLAGASYAVMVTFSRAGYAGFATALVLALAAAGGGPARQAWRERLRRGGALALLVAVALTVMVPVLTGSFAQERLARVEKDFAARQAHWRDALAMRDPGSATRLFGMGLGRFPAIHYWRSAEARAAGYGLVREGETTFLRLGSGSSLYVEQFVALRPHQDYALSLEARSPRGVGRITVSLCEKWLLTSARCAAQTADLPAGHGWRTLQSNLSSGEVGSAPWYAYRPVKLAINNSAPDEVVEVRQVGFTARDGTSLLANADFSAGLDGWFFSADVDLPWHVWSLPVAVLFEQGWLGVVALGLLTVVVLVRAGRGACRGEAAAGAMLAAGAGLALIAATASLVDSPRLLLLMLLIGYLGSIRKYDRHTHTSAIV